MSSLSRISKLNRLALNRSIINNSQFSHSTTSQKLIRKSYKNRSLYRKLFAQDSSAAAPAAPADAPPSSSGGSSGSGNNDDDGDDPKVLKSTIVDSTQEDTATKNSDNSGNQHQDSLTTQTNNEQETFKTDVVPHTAPHYLPYTPIIATTQHPVFPDFVKIISITDQNLANLIQKKVDQKFPYITVVVKRDDNNMDDVAESIDDVYSVGTVCQILEMKMFEGAPSAGPKAAGSEEISENNQGEVESEEASSTTTTTTTTTAGPQNTKNFEKMQILVQGLRRTKIVANLDKDVNAIPDPLSYNAALEEQGEDERFLVGHIDEYPADIKIADKDVQRALSQEIILTLRNIMTKNPITRESIANMVQAGTRITENAAYLSDMCAALCIVETEMIQTVLEEPDLEKRLKLGLEILKLEQKRYAMQEKIRKDVDEKMKEGSKKYILEQELKYIKKELGITKDDKEDLIKRFTDRLVGLNVPEEIQEVIDEEVNRFRSLESHSSEFQVTRNYIDWLTCIKWGVYSNDRLDLTNARKILNQDHYSMKDVKERILEFIAVTKLRGTPSGKIICFHGPPGTGKTSIAKSIAKCLDREYYRFSVGGMSDVNEIKGHRKTYVGSMPGKAIQALKKTKTQNPLILLDEIDKVGSGGHQGDPTAALLELLDPEQNANFLDHYLDVPVDFSKVLFICTANDISRIPGPLRDRMEMIEVGGYILGEKREIAKRHLRVSF